MSYSDSLHMMMYECTCVNSTEKKSQSMMKSNFLLMFVWGEEDSCSLAEIRNSLHKKNCFKIVFKPTDYLDGDKQCKCLTIVYTQ